MILAKKLTIFCRHFDPKSLYSTRRFHCHSTQCAPYLWRVSNIRGAFFSLISFVYLMSAFLLEEVKEKKRDQRPKGNERGQISFKEAPFFFFIFFLIFFSPYFLSFLLKTEPFCGGAGMNEQKLNGEDSQQKQIWRLEKEERIN